MKGTSFFNNKYVLYILSFLGMINFVGYVALEDYNSMALFVVMLLLSRYFSKNWSLNILISILVSSIVSMNNKVREGYIGEMKRAPRRTRSKNVKLGKGTITSQIALRAPPPIRRSKQSGGSGSKTAQKKNLLNTVAVSAPNSTTARRMELTELRRRRAEEEKEKPVEEKPVEEKPVEEKEKEGEVKPKEDGESCKAPVECSSGGCNDGICGPPKSKFTNNVPSSSPSKVNGEDEEDTNVAAKMEDAYNSMNQLLGDGAMKSMAKETKQLVNQQKELMSTLNSMTPALNSAKETLSGLNLPNLEQMTGILKRFNK